MRTSEGGGELISNGANSSWCEGTGRIEVDLLWGETSIDQKDYIIDFRS